MTPKASFVIAAYNADKYLAPAIDSCLGQSLKRIEIIVVDDGSTDGTPDLIKHYAAKDDRVRGISLGVNQGRSVARNTGIQEAKSDIILILDADDIALNQRANITVQHFRKTTDDIVYGQFVRIDSLRNVIEGVDANPFDFEKVKSTGLTYIGHSTMAFRKKVFEKVQYSLNGFSANGIDDWKFQVDAYRAGFKFGAIKKPLAQYRDLKHTRDEDKVKELKALCLSEN